LVSLTIKEGDFEQVVKGKEYILLVSNSDGKLDMFSNTNFKRQILMLLPYMEFLYDQDDKGCQDKSKS
jgi:hypothetical protein